MVTLDLIEGKKKVQAANYDVFDYEAIDFIRLPQSGVFFFEKKLGEIVRVEDRLGWVVDPSAELNESRMAITSHIAGKVIDLKTRRFGYKGEIVTGVAGIERLPHRVGNLNTDQREISALCCCHSFLMDLNFWYTSKYCSRFSTTVL